MDTHHVSIMYNNDGINRRYSESYKLKVLAELSTGKYDKTERSKLYRINRTTLNKWIQNYDRKDLMNTRITVETTDELSRIKALKKEVDQLKYLLLKKDLDSLMLDSYLDIASENLGYKDVADLKKI